MFYCEDCARAHRYPANPFGSRSYGLCEKDVGKTDE